METALYSWIARTNTMGFAYHEVLLNEEGQPCDFTFKEVNAVVENMVGMPADELLGKKASEVFPCFLYAQADLLEVYKEAAAKGSEQEFVYRSQNLDKWYKVIVCSPEELHFATIIIDITKEKSQLASLKNLGVFADSFLLENGIDIDYQKITDEFLDITGARIALFSLYDAAKKTYACKALSCDSKNVKKKAERIGGSIAGKQWVQNLPAAKKNRIGTITRYSSLCEITGGFISESKADLLEKTVCLGETVLIQISKDNMKIGNFVLLMERGKRFDQDIIADLYASQLGMVIAREKTKEALQQERIFTEALFESLPGYFYVYDETGRLIKWNNKHEKMTGYSSEELSRMTMDKWFEGEDAIRVAAAVKEVFETGYGEVEAHLLIKDGSKLFIKSNGVRLTLGGKNYFTGIGMDITKQKQDEEKINNSEAEHREMIANISDVISIVDENGIVRYRSPNIRKIFGWDMEESVGMNYVETTHPDDRDMMKENFAFLLAHEGMPVHMEYRFKKKDGSYSIVELTAINLLKNPNIKGILANFHDITDRKNAENKLRESEEKYRLIAENISDVIWLLNLTRNRFTYFSPSVFYLRGLTPEEAMQERMEDSFSPESLLIANEFLRKNIEDFIKNPNVPVIFRQEFQQPCKNGDMIWVEATAKFQYNTEGEIELVGVSRNIEERKKAEEQILDVINHDQLTGVHSRMFYERELKRTDTEENLPIALMMVDVNGLKLINDAFGHQAGDVLLQRIAAVLKRECDPDHILSRIGGDEFVLIMPKTDAAGANTIIERINKAIEKEQTDTFILSISFGFAVKQKASENMDAIFKDAEDDMYRHKLSDSSSMRSKMIDVIMNSLFEKNKREMLHSQRVGKICEEIAKSMDFASHETNKMRVAGLMHDIGKIGIQNTILNKADMLNADEWDDVRRHSEIGYRILSSVNEFSEIADYILGHHERWDGKGYPKGLHKEEIPVEARIIAVADSYDAMTSDRTYRKGLSEMEAVKEIKDNAGTQFDPVIARVFVEKVLKKVWAG